MFEMLRKLLSALNSSQYSWQISLAIALGMVPGLTPFMSLHNLLFILLAFFLNVHLGLFFISMALFAALAWIFDPAMESLGYWLLTLPALEAFWTGLYNNPFWLLSNFNNTLVIGSLLLGLLLLVPVYLLSEAVIKTYRGPISRLTGKIPLINKVLAFNEEKAAKAKKPARVRWIGLGVFGLLLGGTVLFGMLFLDPLLKNQLEKQLSAGAGAEASVASLQTRLNPLSMEIRGIELPDRDDHHTNAVEVDRIAFNLDLGLLLHKKVLIDELSAEGVRLGVARSQPARALPVAPPEPEPIEKDPTLTQRAAMELGERLPEPRDVVRQETLTSQSEGERIQQELEAIQQKWEQIAADEFDGRAFDDLKARFDDLTREAGSIRRVEDVREIAAQARTLESDTQARINAYRQRLEEFRADRRRSDQLLSELQRLPGADYAALRDKYSFDGEGAFNLAGTLLGEDVTDAITQAQEWYARALPFIRTAQEINEKRKGPQIESPPRGEGRIISFEEFQPRPGFLLKRAAFDVTTQNQSRLAGQLTGATSDQSITGEPMQLGVLSTRPVGYEALEFAWVADSRAADRDDRFALMLLGYDQEGKRADRLRMAPTKLNMDLAFNLTNLRHLSGEGKMIFAPVALSLTEPSGELERIVARTLESVERFDVDIDIGGRLTSPRLRFSTDLDRQLSQRFRAELDERLKQFEAELRAEIDLAVRDQLARAGASAEEIALLESLLAGEINASEALQEGIGQELSREALEAKLQARLDQERAEIEQQARDRAEQERQKAEEAARQRQQEERRRLEQEARDRLRNFR